MIQYILYAYGGPVDVSTNELSSFSSALMLTDLNRQSPGAGETLNDSLNRADGGGVGRIEQVSCLSERELRFQRGAMMSRVILVGNGG